MFCVEVLEALAAPKYLISSSTFGISAVDPSTAISSRLWNSVCRFVYIVFMYFLFKSSNRSLLMCWRCFDGACLVIVWRVFGSWLKKLRSSMVGILLCSLGRIVPFLCSSFFVLLVVRMRCFWLGIFLVFAVF